MENNPRPLVFCRRFTKSIFALYEIHDANALFACLGKPHQSKKELLCQERLLCLSKNKGYERRRFEEPFI